MTVRESVRPVLLSKEQMNAIRQIQEAERSKSALGLTPSIHEIARKLIGNALSNIAAG
ncbi:hypothetical protein SAMN06272783_0045 [Serratia sp. JKS296]|uniref:hypothetical protein n=1 Tax=Serratia sp. JKS296 TaxID=1938824 RepID=UPI000BD5FA2B|nr:hypothetical protein [Serratia sp. JKS296]SOD31153.1 hypothetical protein SAMN06272783_0045 [Serratia sp. JKS296]